MACRARRSKPSLNPMCFLHLTIVLAWAARAAGELNCSEFLSASLSKTEDETWDIGKSLLKGSNSIQNFVDCIPEGGRLRFQDEINMTLKSERSISLVKPISVEGSASVSIDCSSLNNQQPFFEIRGASISISRFTFNNCKGRQPAILDVQDSSNITLSSLRFTSNNVVAVSVKNVAGRVKIHDCSFAHNKARALSTSNSVVEISSTVFYGNSNGAMEIEGLNFTQVSIVNSTFEENRYEEIRGEWQYGAAVLVRESQSLSLNITDSLFKNNSVRFLGGSVYISWLHPKAKVWLKGCEFVGNSAASGGAVYIQGYRNQTRPGDANGDEPFYQDVGHVNMDASSRLATLSDRHSKVHLVECTFSENVARQSGGAVWASQELHVTGSKFLRNSCLDLNAWGGAMLIHAPVLVEFSTFESNAAERGGAMVVKIDDGTVPQSGFCRDLLVAVSHTNFTENAAMDGGAILLDRSRAHFPFWGQYLNITRNKARTGGGICFWGHQPLKSVQNPASSLGFFSKDVVLAAPSLEVIESVLEGNIGFDSGGAIHVEKDFLAVGRSMFLSNLSKDSGGAIRLDRSLSTFDEVTFDGNNAKNGGGVCMDDSIMVASKTVFVGNNATENGGAVSADISHVEWRKEPHRNVGVMECTECRLEGNNASRSGGAIHYTRQLASSKQKATCPLDDQRVYLPTDLSIVKEMEDARFTRICKRKKLLSERLNLLRVILRDTDVISNSAKLGGGGVYVSAVDALEVICQGNNTKQPAKPCPGWHSNMIDGGEGYGPVFASPLTSTQLSDGRILDQKSGEVLPTFYVYLMDGWDQVMRGWGGMRVVLEDVHDILSGQRTSVPMTGIATFTKTVVRASPGAYTFNIHVLSMKAEILVLEVEIRECRIGELETHDGLECESCNSGRYSFDPNDSNCEACPENAECKGSGATIAPSPGFWHPTSREDQVQQCLVPQACNYPDREHNLTQSAKLAHWNNKTLTYNDTDYRLCQEGYDGVLCGSCSPGYGRVHGLECRKCSKEKKKTYFWIVVGTGVALFVVGIFLRDMLSAEGERINFRSLDVMEIELMPSPEFRYETDLNTSRNPYIFPCRSRQAYSSYRRRIVKQGEDVTEATKILVNFLQMTALGLTIDLGWTKSLSTLFLFAGWIGTTFEPLDVELVNLDCLFQRDHILARMVLTFWFPFFVLFLFIVFWAIVWFKSQAAAAEEAMEQNLRQWKGFGRMVWLTTLAVLFVSYTTIARNVYKVMYCVKVDVVDGDGTASSKRYWAENTHLECYTGEHRALLLFLCIPFLVFVTLGFPSALFYTLRTNKDKYGEADFRRKYGFLYSNYRPACCYWETVIMVRKALIVGVVTWTRGLGANLQGLLTALILVLAIVLHLVCGPYKERALNFCEGYSLGASMIVFFAGLVLVDERTTMFWITFVSAVVFLVVLGFLFVTFRYMFQWEGGFVQLVIRLLTEHPLLGTFAMLVGFCKNRVGGCGGDGSVA